MTTTQTPSDAVNQADLAGSIDRISRFIAAHRTNPSTTEQVSIGDLELLLAAATAKAPPVNTTKGGRVPTPTPVAVTRAMNTVLEGAYWPASLSTQMVYRRRQDDTDGQLGPDQSLSLVIGPDGDVWVLLPGFKSLRFRTFFGGGSSLRTRNALLVLAEAIRRDNAKHPQSPDGLD